MKRRERARRPAGKDAGHGLRRARDGAKRAKGDGHERRRTRKGRVATPLPGAVLTAGESVDPRLAYATGSEKFGFRRKLILVSCAERSCRTYTVDRHAISEIGQKARRLGPPRSRRFPRPSRCFLCDVDARRGLAASERSGRDSRRAPQIGAARVEIENAGRRWIFGGADARRTPKMRPGTAQMLPGRRRWFLRRRRSIPASLRRARSSADGFRTHQPSARSR